MGRREERRGERKRKAQPTIRTNHCRACPTKQRKPRKKMSANLAVYTSLSLLGLVALAGAGVGVGSGVAMMSMQMMDEAEKTQKAQGKPAAASPVEKIVCNMSFAASGVKH